MISIVVPIYNTESYLPQCLSSLINQTYRDLEIICINDGSTDGSLEILEQYAAKDERIIVISRENQGASESRNEGIRLARGEWLMFVDSDDWIEPDCCKKLLVLSAESDLVMASYVREYNHTSAPKLLFGEDPIPFTGARMDWLFERMIAPSEDELAQPEKIDSLSTIWGKLYRISIVRAHNIEIVSTKKIGTLEDLLFNLNYLRWAKSAYYIPDCLYHYRKNRRGSLTYNYKPSLDRKWLWVFDEAGRIISGSLDEGRLWKALQRRKALCLLGLGLNIVFSRKPLGEQRRMLREIITSEWYIEAIEDLDTRPMPLYWRFFYGSARRKLTWPVIMMLQAINVIISR